MFPSREKKKLDPDNLYDRHQGLTRSRNLSVIACGLLCYQLFQAYMEFSSMPWWFVLIMLAMIGATGLLILWCSRMIKEVNEEMERIEGAGDSTETVEEDTFDDEDDDPYDEAGFEVADDD